MTESYSTICANVSLTANGKQVSFSYEGADELSKRHVDPDGNIDCAEPADLGKGPVDLEFRIQTGKLTLDGIDYEVEFAGRESIGIKEEKGSGYNLAYLLGCLLKGLNVKQGQFGGYTNPGGNPHKLRFTNRNNDKKRYKYTLRARARAESGGAVSWLEHDPIIQNGGGGTGTF